MILTQRAEDIIRILIRFPQGEPVTAAIISDELNISTRSIQRELPTVEDWLLENGFHLVRKRSAGLFLDEPEDRKNDLLRLLDDKANPKYTADDRGKRQEFLRQELLFSAEPMKSQYFTAKLGISEGTLSSDLNQLTPWFRKFKLNLVRRPGRGIFLEGTEIARRQAITSYLYNKLNDKNSAERVEQANVLRQHFESDVVNKVSQIILEGEEQLSLRLTDNAFLHLLLYLSYSVQRIQRGFPLTSIPQDVTALSIEAEYAVAEYLMRQLRQAFHLPIIDTETAFLTIYLTGFRIWPADRRDLTRQRDFDIHQITLSLIRETSELLSVDFQSDTRLPGELGAHIQPTLGRIRAGIPIENPLLNDFRQNYEETFAACRIACQRVAEEFELPEFPESEVGFITIYFAMALDRQASYANRIRVVVVCPTGIGSSRLLAETLKKEYPDLDVCGIISAFDIVPEKLSKQGIEMIISTVKLDVDFRWINVNPILTRQDRMLLDSKLKLLHSHKKTQENNFRPIPTAPISRIDVEYIKKLGETIYHILDNIRFGHAPVLQTREEIISYSATLFGETPELEDHFYQIMKTRDMIADTYMKPFHALLLHGKSRAIDEPCFGYVHLEPPIYENGQIILGAIVSFIPDPDPGSMYAPLASEIIGALMEDAELLRALRRADDERFRMLLEVALLKYYKKTVREVLE